MVHPPPPRTRGRLISLVSRAVALPLPVLIIAVVVSVGAVLASQALLDGFYARSGYPVPYYVGQLSFSAARLQGWYGDMLDRGTLGVYWQTQFVDFGFIAATLLLHVAALVLWPGCCWSADGQAPCRGSPR